MGSTPNRGVVYGSSARATQDPADPPSATPADGTSSKGRSPRWAKVLIIVGASLVVLSGLGVGGSWALMNRYESKVSHEDLLGGAGVSKEERDKHFASGAVNLLLLGSDSRGPDSNIGQRSDTIMIVHIAASRDKAAVISIPRDSFVDVPAGGNWKGGPNKLNAAFAFGGAPLAAKAVNELTGVPLDGAMVANFGGIRTMVDAVGGVNVCINRNVKSSFSSRYWAKGCHQMDGAEAEEFMRQRKNLSDGDFGRMKDQQLVVKAVIEKVSAEGLLANPLQLDKLMVTAAQALTIDKSLNLQQLAGIAKGIKPSAVQFAQVPHANAGLKTFAGSSVQLDMAQATPMFEAIRSDTIDQWIAANPSAANSP